MAIKRRSKKPRMQAAPATKKRRKLARPKPERSAPLTADCVLCGESGPLFCVMDYDDEPSAGKLPPGDRCVECGRAEVASDYGTKRAERLISAIAARLITKGRERLDAVRAASKAIAKHRSPHPSIDTLSCWDSEALLDWERKLSPKGAA